MRNHRLKKAAFSLVEVLFAVMLVGMAIASLLAANGMFTKTNAVGTELSTAEFLLEQIRERSVSSSYEDLNGLLHFDGATFSPPIDADGQYLNDFAQFSEQITLENVSEQNFEQAVAHESGFVRVTAKVFLNSKEICSASWIRASY
ncbi:MAG: type IV pilus modification PilV family protein [Planctomycetota bacterium]|jgi:type II secretory pathway pseudopilin PulG